MAALQEFAYGYSARWQIPALSIDITCYSSSVREELLERLTRDVERSN